MEQLAGTTEKDVKESRPLDDSKERVLPRQDVKEVLEKMPENEHHYEKRKGANYGLPWSAWQWCL